MRNYIWIKNQDELDKAIKTGYEMLLSIVSDDRGELVACYENNYRKVFEEITGHVYDDEDGTFGDAFPITETFGLDSIFDL